MQQDQGREGFTAERLSRLSRMEEWHFWFVGRRALVGQLLSTYLPDGKGLIADVGCGTGLMLRRLARDGRPVVGMDLRPEGLAATRAAMPRAWVVQAKADGLPLCDGVAEGVLMLDVLEHVDDRATLAEVWRVLRPGGVLVLTVPAMPWLWSYRDEAAGHLRRYTRRGLRERLAGCGFEVVELGYYQCLLFPLVAASRWVGRNSRKASHREERPLGPLNWLLGAVNRAEVAIGKVVPWPWGSSLAAVCRKREG